MIFLNPKNRAREEVEKFVLDKLIDGQWFYCNEWGLPDLHFKEFGYDPEIDHEWHEFENLEETNEQADDNRNIEDLLSFILNPRREA